MKIKNLHLAIVAGIALSISSCGNKNSEKDNAVEELSREYDNSVSETNEEVDPETVSEEVNEKVALSKGGDDFDAFLNSYEEYVDQYIVFMKKAQTGDMAAMTEYIEYLEKATALSEKMEKGASEMTSVQMSKFLKIQNKLTQAASKLR